MRASRPDIRQKVSTPLGGFGVVLLALACFLLLLWGIIVVVRFVAG